jgi:hypothetical protein
MKMDLHPIFMQIRVALNRWQNRLGKPVTYILQIFVRMCYNKATYEKPAWQGAAR